MAERHAGRARRRSAQARAQIANTAGSTKPKQAGNLMHPKIIAHCCTFRIGTLIYSALDVQQMAGGPFSGSVTYINAINNGVPLFSFPSPFLTSGTTSVQNVAGVNPHLKNP